MSRVKCSIADHETKNHLFTATRNEDPKSFSNFVNQVISNAPVNLQKKKNSTIYKRDGDPISVLHNHGLLSIDKGSKIKDCSGSEIDVTFYTEETHLGELVKLFSSTHKFRNGKLVYASTQEVAPQVTEEVENFNKQWQLVCSPEMMKENKGEKCPFSKLHLPKKSLMDMISDLDKEQTLKRYGKSSIRDQILHHKKPLIKPGCCCENKETTCDNDLRNQDIEKYFEESRKLMSDCYVKEDVIKNHRQYEERDLSEQKPVGKKIYHAAWRQRSPKKSPSKTVRFRMEQALNDMSSRILKTPKGQKSIITDQAEARKTYSRSTIKELLMEDVSSDSSDCPRIYQRHAEGCEEEWAERLKGQKCRYPFNVRNKTHKKQPECHLSLPKTNYSGARYTETLKLHVEAHKSHPDRRRKSSARRIYSDCCAEGNIFLGDNEASSSSSNTSVCTVYYDCESEYIKRSSPETGGKDNFSNHRHCYHEKMKTDGRKKTTERRENSYNVGLFHNLNKSQVKKSPRKDLDPSEILEVAKHCCHNKKYECKECQAKLPPRHKQQSKKVGMECFSEYRQRNREHHHTAVTRESLVNVNSHTSPTSEDELQTLNIMKNMVNSDALEDFQRRYGKCLCNDEDLQPIPSYSRQNFKKKIEKSHRHKHL